MCQIANRLSEKIDDRDLLGRLEGDEFALIIRRNLRDEMVFEYIQEIQSVFNKVFEIKGNEIKVTASFGLATYPADGKTSENLLKAADMAMYSVKETGKNNIQFYRHEMHEIILSKIEMEDYMIQAIRNEEFFLLYQPLYSLKKIKQSDLKR